VSDLDYSISLEGAPSADDERIIDEGLAAYGAQFAPPDDQRPVSVMLRSSDGWLAGGLLGETQWGWLYVNTLWIEESARHRGYGSKLLKLAEREAVRRGCRAAYLSTLSYEARPFYERHGYEVCGEYERTKENV
jgi:GNAT superfamily N-acetyltransferase